MHKAELTDYISPISQGKMSRAMHIEDSTVDIPPIPQGKNESKLIKIKRSSGRYEYVTPGELEILNIQKKERKRREEAYKDRIHFVGMLILAVVMIMVMILYINNKYRPVYDKIQQPSIAFEEKKPVIITTPDDIIKIEPDTITDSHLIASQSPSTAAVTQIIEPSIAVPADDINAALVEDNNTNTVEVMDDKARIAEVLSRWSDAWSNQRIEEYLSFYHDDFQPAQGVNKQSWIKDRWSKISRPTWIKVTITAMETDLIDKNRARVIFKQQYESPNYRDAVLKTIHLVVTGTQWKIIREESVKI